MVITFKKPVAISVDRLSVSARRTISAPRGSTPTASSIRIALARKVKVNSIPAAERLYVDLLPETWTRHACPVCRARWSRNWPSRALEAERQLRQQRLSRQDRRSRRRSASRSRRQPTFTRYVFAMPDVANVVPENAATASSRSNSISRSNGIWRTPRRRCRRRCGRSTPRSMTIRPPSVFALQRHAEGAHLPRGPQHRGRRRPRPPPNRSTVAEQTAPSRRRRQRLTRGRPAAPPRPCPPSACRGIAPPPSRCRRKDAAAAGAEAAKAPTLPPPQCRRQRQPAAKPAAPRRAASRRNPPRPNQAAGTPIRTRRSSSMLRQSGDRLRPNFRSRSPTPGRRVPARRYAVAGVRQRRQDRPRRAQRRRQPCDPQRHAGARRRRRSDRAHQAGAAAPGQPRADGPGWIVDHRRRRHGAEPGRSSSPATSSAKTAPASPFRSTIRANCIASPTPTSATGCWWSPRSGRRAASSRRRISSSCARCRRPTAWWCSRSPTTSPPSLRSTRSPSRRPSGLSLSPTAIGQQQLANSLPRRELRHPALGLRPPGQVQRARRPN